VDFLASFTADPKSVIPDATMPGYADALTPEQIRDIAAYLYSLKVEEP
jgi:mono/diheme cytochrome c family protein